MLLKRGLLYAVPLLLLALNLLPVAIYKDTVDFSTQATSAFSLEPSHWRLIDYSANVNASVSEDQTGSTQLSKPLSDGADFKGFPFGAYFSRSASAASGHSASSVNYSAWSWLWVTVDALLFVVTVLISWKLSRSLKRVHDDVVPISQQAQYSLPTAAISQSTIISPTSQVSDESSSPNTYPPSAPTS